MLLQMKRRPVSMPMAAYAAAAAVAGVAALCDYVPTGLPAHSKDQEKFVAPLLPKRSSLATDVQLLAFGTELGFVEHQATASSAAIGGWKHSKDQEKFVAPLLPKRGSLATDVQLLAFGTELGFVEHQATASSAAIGGWKYEVSNWPPKANFCCQDHLHVTLALKPSPYVCG